MTPDKARRMLELAAGADFVIHLDSDEAGPLLVEAGGAPLTVPELTLAAHAPVLAAMIAGMREEWRAEFQAADDKKWYPLTEWAEGEPDRRPWNVAPTRIVRRYVTPTEEV